METPKVTASGARRSQRRSQETRNRVLDAAVRCIAEEGSRAANLAQIAAGAGVSIGAIQHQFGDKSSVLLAVVERTFEELAAEVDRLREERLPLGPRVERFVETVWARYGAPASRASIEILILMRSDPAFRGRSLPFLARVRGHLDALWTGTFRDAPAGRRGQLAAQRRIFTTLNGLAIERIFLPESDALRQDLADLAEEVLRLLLQGTAPD